MSDIMSKLEWQSLTHCWCPQKTQLTWKFNYFPNPINFSVVIHNASFGDSQHRLQGTYTFLWSEALALMGKNTMTHKAINQSIWDTTYLWRNSCLIPRSMRTLRSPRRTSLTKDMLLARMVLSVHAGTIVPCEVAVPAQNAGPWALETF